MSPPITPTPIATWDPQSAASFYPGGGRFIQCDSKSAPLEAPPPPPPRLVPVVFYSAAAMFLRLELELAERRPAATAADLSFLTRPKKSESGLPMSSAGGAHSASLPSSMVTMRSESSMVWRRWAMVSVVAWANLVRSDRWTTASVSRSMFAVASSTASTFGFRRTARARQMSWRWPVDQLAPPSSTADPRPSGCCSRTALVSRQAQRRASHRAASWNSPNASRLSRNVPTKRTGSCGMMPSVRRSLLRGILAVSSPPSKIRPSVSMGVMRKRATRRDDLPDPERPQTPTFDPPGISRQSRLITRGRPLR
mmetsp:Transcript_41337/g.93133  ORF Transcript_41337/g.93133 Transcript_41337/m.93133 type:complete len:310 (-) Transcript_41337:1308-2237(-)